MDELLEEFNNSLQTQHFDRGEPQQQLGDNKSNFDGLYKNWGKLGHQEQRRKEILEVQKSNRNNKLDSYRGILEIVQAVENKEIFGSNRQAYYRPSIYVAGFNKVSYNNVLMMSEWLIEKPEDLHENWFVVPCPKGVRMIVVATQGITKCYTKYGHYRFQMRTALPGGNPCEPQRKHRCCVLDCFYYEKTNTMFILDLLAWNQPMTDGETEFRHYWLESQIAEIPGLKIINKKNEMVFKILPKYQCTVEELNKLMQTYPMFEDNVPPLDGLLFYHKKAHYVGGETPLVGWLFPYMVSEVLGTDIKVHEKYMSQKPSDYVNQAEFIMQFEAKLMKKKGRRSSSSVMDTTDESQDHDEKSELKKTACAPAFTEMTTDENNANSEVKTADVMESENIEKENNANIEEKAVEDMESENIEKENNANIEEKTPDDVESENIKNNKNKGKLESDEMVSQNIES